MTVPDLTTNPYWAEDQQVGADTGVSPRLLSAQQWFESSWNPAAVSPTGAFGLSQFEPATAAEFGVQEGTTAADVATQIEGEAKYLVQLYGEEGGWEPALEAYNAGPGGVSDAAANGAQAYATEILAAAGNSASGAPNATTTSSTSSGTPPATTTSWITSLIGGSGIGTTLTRWGLTAVGVVAGLGLVVAGAYKTTTGSGAKKT